MFNAKKLVTLSGLMVAGLALHPAFAQTAASVDANGNALEEVVVTAEHRSTDLQRVGLAVTAISGDEISQRGQSDVGQVLQDVPGVVLQGVTDGPSQQSVQGGGGPPNIAIRGLGTPTPNTVGAVAVYEDGVLLQGGGANFYDMSRVEVLRGPQGTLYGRGATAGAVNLITNNPTQNFEAGGRVSFGDYNLVSTQGMLNVPVSNDLAVRVAFNQIHHSGYFNNGQSDEDDYNIRAKALYKPVENFSLLLGYEDYKANGTGPGQISLVGNPNPSSWSTTLLGGGFNPINYRKAFADLEWGLGFADLTYIGGYQTSNSVFGTYCVCFAPGPPPTPNLSYQYINMPTNTTWTHEVRLASAGSEALSWQVGAYYLHGNMATNFEPGYSPPVQGESYSPFFTVAQSFSPRSLGLFGELTYALTSTTSLTGGLRETHDHIVQSQTLPFGTPNDFDETLSHLDWKARVETQLTAQNMVYGMISTGYRPGAFVNGIAGQNEKVTAYEVGSKNRVESGVTLNGALFYYKYSGFQNVVSVPNTDPATDAQNPVITELVPLPATFYGAELEASFQFTPVDKLTLSPSVEEAKYTGSLPGYATDGGTIPNTPKFSASGSYEHTFELPQGKRLSWEADAHYQTSVLTDFDASNYPSSNPTFLQKAYSIVNSSLTYAPEDGKYSVSVWGKNLTNTLVKLTVYNANPPSVYVNDPLTFGVTLSAKL